MRKKVFVGVLILLITISALIAVPNFTPKARASAPEVYGQWIGDDTCGPGGWRCWQYECYNCWCRDVGSGDCCN
ncbi:MAG TPA: hypothetical protein PKU99_08925 [Candidatus Saccharicenans sp.]|jgi:hypothetical protein|nr:hypothetical protein [Candidatus Saccharicenans sp.]HPU94237.1 hypothetical protein [Candidatus Saccharicenans sp.]HQM74234.1 hypothetical protein [Candidatus Saccharicenans sp.]